MLFRLFVFAILMLDGMSKLTPQVREYSIIELNHRHDEFGTHCYDQIILWQWDPHYRRHDVVCWWLVENNSVDRLPTKSGEKWQVLKLIDGQRFKFKAAIYRETWTSTDPERENSLLRDASRRIKIK